MDLSLALPFLQACFLQGHFLPEIHPETLTQSVSAADIEETMGSIHDDDDDDDSSGISIFVCLRQKLKLLKESAK